jgi:hypothetical protein
MQVLTTDGHPDGGVPRRSPGGVNRRQCRDAGGNPATPSRAVPPRASRPPPALSAWRRRRVRRWTVTGGDGQKNAGEGRARRRLGGQERWRREDRRQSSSPLWRSGYGGDHTTLNSRATLVHALNGIAREYTGGGAIAQYSTPPAWLPRDADRAQHRARSCIADGAPARPGARDCGIADARSCRDSVAISPLRARESPAIRLRFAHRSPAILPPYSRGARAIHPPSTRRLRRHSRDLPHPNLSRRSPSGEFSAARRTPRGATHTSIGE